MVSRQPAAPETQRIDCKRERRRSCRLLLHHPVMKIHTLAPAVAEFSLGRGGVAGALLLNTLLELGCRRQPVSMYVDESGVM